MPIEYNFGFPSLKIKESTFGFPDTFCEETKNLLNKWASLGAPAPDSDKLAVNSTILYLKEKGEWNKLDCLFKFDVHNKVAALVDWKNPNSRMATIVNDYATSFTAYRGFEGNGSNFRINTNFNPGDGTNYNYNSGGATRGVYISSGAPNSTRVDVSGESATNSGNGISMLSAASPPVILNYTNASSDSFTEVYNQLYGWHITRRYNSSTYMNFKNGQSITTNLRSRNSISVPNVPIYLFCRNVAGTFSSFSSKVQGGVFFGGGNIDEKIIVNGLNKYSLMVNSIPKTILIADGNSFTADASWSIRYLESHQASNTIADFIQGKGGRETREMIQLFNSGLGKIDVSGYNKVIFFQFEVTNDMSQHASNYIDTYNNLVTHCKLARERFGSNCKILVSTCLPRGGASPITPANRQNPLDLNDTNTLNGLIRTNYLSFADDIIDIGGDATMGIDSGGVAGVGEKNTTYYLADEIHPTPTGYEYLTDNYITPKLDLYI